MDTKRVIGLVVLLAAVLVFGMAATLAFQDEIEDYSPQWLVGSNNSGTVLNIDPSSITIQTSKGTSQTYKLTVRTRFVLSGNVPIGPGALVKITYKDVKVDKIARIVRVLKEAPAGAAAASPVPAASATTSPASAASTGASSPAPAASPATAPSGAPASTSASPAAASPAAAGTPGAATGASPAAAPSAAASAAAAPGAASAAPK